MSDKAKANKEEEDRLILSDAGKTVITIEPSFDLKGALTKLQSCSDTISPKEKLRIILGIHVRFYHSALPELTRMLKAGGAHVHSLKLVKRAISSCKACSSFARAPNTPKLKTSISTFFNQNVVTDLIIIDKVHVYCIYVDDCTRYKVVCRLMNKSAECWLKAFLEHWVRYFGPPKKLTTDQEGALMSELTSRALQRFNIEFNAVGSEGHTGAGLAEASIRLVKLIAYKLKHSAHEAGLTISFDDLMIEAAMACNLMLNYNRHCPLEAVIGYVPRDPYDPESCEILAHTGALEFDEDIFETQLRLRILAKEAILNSIVQERLTKANNTKVVQAPTSTFSVGDVVDLFRPPQHKGLEGWTGPHTLIHIAHDRSKAIVLCKSLPLLVPIRHIRLHVPVQSFVLRIHMSNPVNDLNPLQQFKLDFAAIVTRIVSHVEGLNVGTHEFIGTTKRHDGTIKLYPDDFQANAPPVFRDCQVMAKQLYQLMHIDGVVFANGVRRLPAVYGCSFGSVVAWVREARDKDIMVDVNPSSCTTVSSICSCFRPFGSSDTALVMFYRFNISDEEAEQREWNMDIDTSDLASDKPMSFDDICSISIDNESMREFDPDDDNDSKQPPPPPGAPGNAVPFVHTNRVPFMPIMSNPIIHNIGTPQDTSMSANESSTVTYDADKESSVSSIIVHKAKVRKTIMKDDREAEGSSVEGEDVEVEGSSGIVLPIVTPFVPGSSSTNNPNLVVPASPSSHAPSHVPASPTSIPCPSSNGSLADTIDYRDDDVEDIDKAEFAMQLMCHKLADNDDDLGSLQNEVYALLSTDSGLMQDYNIAVNESLP